MNTLNTLAQVSESDYKFSDGSTISTSDAGAIATFAGFFVLFTIGIGLVLYAIHAFFLGKIFKKAGLSQGVAWVPFYNNWKLLELGSQQGFWAVLTIIPVINIVSAGFIIIAMYHIGRQLQKDGWFVLIAIFLPLIWEGWLALDSSTWRQRSKASASHYKAS